MSLKKILQKYKLAHREDLIPLLQEVQEAEGYLSEEAIVQVGKLLQLSTTKIYGLATFYDQFRFSPAGSCHIRMCYGTACYLSGARSVYELIREELGIEDGQTTRDGTFSLELVSCIGACGEQPVLQIDGTYYFYRDRFQLKKLLASCREKKEEEKHGKEV